MSFQSIADPILSLTRGIHNSFVPYLVDGGLLAPLNTGFGGIAKTNRRPCSIIQTGDDYNDMQETVEHHFESECLNACKSLK